MSKNFSVVTKYVEARPRSQRHKSVEARSGASLAGGLSTVDLSALNNSISIVNSTLLSFRELFDELFEKDADNNAIKAKLSLYSLGGITAGGVGSGSSSGSGSSYSRLDSWGDYSADKAGYVLSALLGNDLHSRVQTIEGAGYITQSALANYALRSELPTKVSALTNDSGYITGITSSMVVTALGYTPYDSANFTKSNIKSTLGISDWALATTKPTYTASEVGALGVSKELNSGSLNDYTTAGIYRFNTISDASSEMANYGNLLVVRGGTHDTLTQLYFNYYGGETFIRSGNLQMLPSANWNRLAFTSDIPTKLSQLTDDVVAGKYLSTQGGTINGSLTAPTFIGNLTGNADSATKLTTGNLDYATVNGNNVLFGYYSARSNYDTIIAGKNLYLRYGTTPTDGVILSSGGNVAIGGTSASEKLHVYGNILSSANIKAQTVTIGGITLTYDATNNAVCVNGNLYATGGVTAGGVGSDSSSGSGSSYSRLDSWGDYSADKAGYVLSALLGNELNQRLTTVEGAGYITQSALANYALRSELPTKVSALTNDSGYITGITSSMVVTALGYTPYDSANFTKSNIKSTLGISDWALASAKPTYTASEVGALGVSKELNSGSLNDYTTAGIYRFNTISDASSEMANYGNLLVVRGGTHDTLTQLYFNYYGGEAFIRSGNLQMLPSANWNRLAFASDIPTKLSQLTDDVVAGKYLSTQGGTINGSLTASSFIGNLTGNADSATFTPILKETASSTSWLTTRENELNINNSIASTRFWFGHRTPEGSPYPTTQWHFGNGSGNGEYGNVYAATFIGNLSGNADSATKLATARTIWGQSFDGTKDITEGITLRGYKETGSVTKISDLGGRGLFITASPNNTRNYWGMAMWTESDGTGFIQQQNWDNSLTYNISLQPFGGNVGVGSSIASEKLHVHGNILSTANVKGSSVTIGGITLTYDATNNAVCVNGNLYTTGGITAGQASDARLKQNVATMTEQDAISTIMALRPVTFEWNALARSHDGRLYGNSQGFIAQEFERLIENSGRAIYGHYRAIDTTKAIPYLTTVAQNHERRISDLERENKALREEVEHLRKVA